MSADKKKKKSTKGELSASKGSADGFHSVSDYVRDLQLFQSVVPLEEVKLKLPNEARTEQLWKWYELGGEEDVMFCLDPVVFIPGETCGAEAYFYELDALSAKGYKCVVVQYPTVQSIEEFTVGFGLFLDHIRAVQIHLFGNSLGGYLAQCYSLAAPRRIASLMLCNSYRQPPSYSYMSSAGMIGMLPVATLHGMVISNKNQDEEHNRKIHTKIREAQEWLHGRMRDGESLEYDELVCRCVLMYTSEEVSPLILDKKKILIIESNDLSDDSLSYMEELKKTYKSAKIAQLKQGGDYPFLCDVTGLNIYVEVHLRNNGYFDRLEEVQTKGDGANN